MIWESAPWKEKLLADADLLERWSTKKRISQRRSFLVEQRVFLAAYAIRKLIEAGKLSSSFEGRAMECQTFSAVSDYITVKNSHRIHELYDLECPIKRVISAMDLINVIIHSFIFSEALGDDDSIDGFFVTSDRKRYDCLWWVDVGQYIRLMREVGHDYPACSHAVFDDEKNEWVEWRGTGNPPPYIEEKLNATIGRYGA